MQLRCHCFGIDNTQKQAQRLKAENRILFVAIFTYDQHITVHMCMNDTVITSKFQLPTIKTLLRIYMFTYTLIKSKFKLK